MSFLNSGKASAFRGQCMKMHAMLQLKFMDDYGNFAKIIAKFRKSLANTQNGNKKCGGFAESLRANHHIVAVLRLHGRKS